MPDSPDAEFAIKTENLTKHYRSAFWRLKAEPALNQLNLEVPRGTVYGFLGPNGAGKTTTIKLLIDLLRPTAGKAWILGKACDNVEVREKIGYLPDSPAFGSYLTATQFLTLCARLLKIPKAKRRDRVQEVLHTVGMADSAKDTLGGFSRGMVQRIGVAQALLNCPELLILDEPLIGLDPHGREELLQIVREQKKAGVSVFFCSHILSDVERLCDQIGILRKGELLCSGPLNDLLQNRGVCLILPPGQDALAKDLMIHAESTSPMEDGRWNMEFSGQKWKEVKQKSLPDGVVVEPRKEDLQAFLFRQVKETGIEMENPEPSEKEVMGD